MFVITISQSKIAIVISPIGICKLLSFVLSQAALVLHVILEIYILILVSVTDALHVWQWIDSSRIMWYEDTKIEEKTEINEQ